MTEWQARWLKRKIYEVARCGTFIPVISAWGNAGVFVKLHGLMEFQWRTDDGATLWKVMGQTVARFNG